MPRTTTLLDDHTQGILDALAPLPFPLGDGEAPRDVNQTEIDPPYVALYSLPGGTFDGPLNDSQADVTLLYQITSVGKTRAQAQVAIDICRTLMKKDNVTVLNRKVRDLRHLTPNSGVIRDDDLPDPLFYGYDRYELDTTPL